MFALLPPSLQQLLSKIIDSCQTEFFIRATRHVSHDRAEEILAELWEWLTDQLATTPDATAITPAGWFSRCETQLHILLNAPPPGSQRASA